MKRFISITAAFCLMFMLFKMPIDISTESLRGVVASGDCGENVTWSLDDSGLLTISGTGDMRTYYYLSNKPWFNFKSQITNIVIDNGVTNITVSSVKKINFQNHFSKP